MDQVNETTTPRTSDDLAWVEQQGELVVYDPRRAQIHVLSDTGALLLPLFDGSVTLGQLANEIAAEFSTHEELVLGDVVRFTATLVELGLLDDGASEPPPGDRAGPPRPSRQDGRPRHLPQPSVPCGDLAPKPSWIGSITVRAGEFNVGLSADDQDVLASLRSSYVGSVVDDDDRTGLDYGISLAAPARAGARPIPFLAHSCAPQVRSQSVARLLRSQDAHLAALARPSVDGALGLLRMAAVVRGGAAVLVPQVLLERGPIIERTLREHDLAVADSPAALLDPDARAVTVREPFGVDTWSTRDALIAAPGTYSLVRVFWLDGDAGADETPARALGRMMRHVTDFGGLEPQATLEALAGLLPTFTGGGLDLRDRDVWGIVAAPLARG
ncbi:MAG: PqqD family protein [Acidimicrobiales bacterium]